MKKKLAIIFMSLSVLTSISACGGTEKEGNTPNPESTISDSENSENDQMSSEKTLDNIESYMLNSGVLSGERTQMAADMVGGIDGFKYADSGVEIYEYDINSEEYIALSNGEEVELKGMNGFTVRSKAINGKFVLMGEPTQEAIDAFNSFK